MPLYGPGGAGEISPPISAAAADIIGLGSTVPRLTATAAANLSAGFLILTRVVVLVSEECVGVRVMPNQTSTASLLKWALFEEDMDGDLTRIAVTAHSPSTNSVEQNLPWLSPVQLDVSKGYILGSLSVGAATQFRGVSGNAAVNAMAPYKCRFSPAAGGLTDMPSSVPVADISTGSATIPLAILV